MSIKVNLITKGRKNAKSKGVVVKVLIALFSVLSLGFLVSTCFVVFKTISLNRQMNLVSLETVAVSSEIRADNENVNKFVLSKGVLDYVYEIDKSKFHYKKYLDEILAILPDRLVLRGVDFQVKGWVSVVVFIPDLESLRSFEDRITDQTILDQTVFATVFSEGVVKEKTGGYIIRLQFELKKNV